jgi:hypothetical protein
MSPRGAEAFLCSGGALSPRTELLTPVSRSRAGMLDWGSGMVAEFVFYLLTALLFSVGLWFAVNLLL